MTLGQCVHIGQLFKSRCRNCLIMFVGVHQKKLNPLRNDRFYRLDQDKKNCPREDPSWRTWPVCPHWPLAQIFVASVSPRSGGAPNKSENPLEMTDFSDSTKTKKLSKRRPELEHVANVSTLATCSKYLLQILNRTRGACPKKPKPP